MVTQVELEQFRNMINTEVETKVNELNRAVQVAGNSIEALEKQVATLSIGCMEQAVLIEALLEQLPEEAHANFVDYATRRRKEMLDAIKDGSDVLSGDD